MRIRIIPLFLIIGLMCALFGLSLGCASGSLIRITPDSSASANLSIDAAEEINEYKFMLTYVCCLDTVVKGMNKSIEATVIGTNYNHLYVMGYGMTNGGFFTKEMQERSNKAAVINEKAAFDIFGGNGVNGSEVMINGESYMVCGVIDDKNDEACVYIPADMLGRALSELICVTDEKISAEYVKNELKYIGVTEDKYTFAEESAIERLLINNFYASVYLFAIGLAVAAALRLVKQIGIWNDFAKEEMEKEYFRDFLSQNGGLCLKIIGSAVGTAACFAAVVYTASKLLDIYLYWSEMHEASLSSARFIASNIVLLLYVAACLLYPFIQNVLNTLHNAKLRVEER